MAKFRIDYWELGPLGWRGCSELDEQYPDIVQAVAGAHGLLVDADRDGVIGYAAVVRLADDAVVWEARNHGAELLEAVNN